MFQISRQVDYAIQFLHRLAELEGGETMSLKRFSEESTISFAFLQKIARILKQAGLIESKQGTSGGYSLSVPLESISIKRVIDVLEGQYTIVDCAKGENMCSKSAACKTKGMWLKINRNITTELENTSIAQFS